MRTGKLLLLGLLILIGVCLIFSGAGVGNYELLNNFISNQLRNSGEINYLATFIKYPPATSYLLSSILAKFPWNNNDLFYLDIAWQIHKVILYSAYISTYFTLLHLSRSLSSDKSISKLDLTLLYFGSVAILLLSVALAFFEIFAVPFFVLCVSFIFRKRYILAFLLFLLAASFSWSVLAFTPFLFLISRKNGFLVLPIILGFLYLYFVFRGGRVAMIDPGAIIPMGLFNFFNQIEIYVLKDKSIIKAIALAIISIFPIKYMIDTLVETFVPKFRIGRIGYIAVFMLTTIAIAATIFLEVTAIVLPVIFMVLYLCFLIKVIIDKNLTRTKAISVVLPLCSALVLFFPSLIAGALIWIPVMLLISYLSDPSPVNRLGIWVGNIVTFVCVFSVLGTTGSTPVRGDYFDVFRFMFCAGFIYFHCLILAKKVTEASLKRMLIIFLVLVNIGYITAVGSSDTGAWAVYATTSVKANNPLASQVAVVNGIDQRYPPLSSIIMGYFAIAQRKVAGISSDYATSTKLSIFTFYALSLVVLLKYARPYFKGLVMSWKDKLLLLLTTFSLTLESQGLAYTNVYTIPSMFLAVVTLFKRKYLLSGLLMGITISIKWQPIILIPLIGATMFHFQKDFKSSIKDSFVFVVGLLIPPVIAWGLVLLQPDGLVAMERSVSYLVRGAPMLSGQALNLNWIVTYIIHIVNPSDSLSLEHIRYLNRPVIASLAPVIFRGALFMLAAFVVLWRYWLFQKKNIVNFLGAATLIFFSHFILNKSAYEAHLIYAVYFAVYMYITNPNPINRLILILLDIMTFMNLVFFYGFTGNLWVNRLLFGFDMTVLFSAYYVIIYFWMAKRYIAFNSNHLSRLSRGFA